MDSKQIFNRYYQKYQEKYFSQSLLSFFEAHVRHRIPEFSTILDLGCGNYSIFEEVKDLKAEIIAIDFSSEAIREAPKSAIHYREKSLTDDSFFSEDKFNLIFDSHCMNCLVEESQRAKAFENIFNALKTDGLFASEFMVQPIDHRVEMPLKMIKTARELEEEILSHKFKIIYFTILRDSSFVNEINGEKITCDVLRVIARK